MKQVAIIVTLAFLPLKCTLGPFVQKPLENSPSTIYRWHSKQEIPPSVSFGVAGTTAIERRGMRYVHMEVGHAAQNVYLQAVALDLGTVAIGAFDDAGMKRVAHLSEHEQPLLPLPYWKVTIEVRSTKSPS